MGRRSGFRSTTPSGTAPTPLRRMASRLVWTRTMPRAGAAAPAMIPAVPWSGGEDCESKRLRNKGAALIPNVDGGWRSPRRPSWTSLP